VAGERAKRLECAAFRRFWSLPLLVGGKAPECGALQTLRAGNVNIAQPHEHSSWHFFVPCPLFRAYYLGTGNRSEAMIGDTIGKIEARIQGADAIKEERRQELLHLLGTLKSEVAELSKTHGEQAESIAGFTELSTHEATRTEQNPELLDLSLQGLSSSVAGFEDSHPRLVQIVNAISNTLSNLGI
jgi:hypothetical protein